MINDAIKSLLKKLPNCKPEGYWKAGRGFVIKIKPSTDDPDYFEELLFYIEGDDVAVTNPVEQPAIIDKEMIKL